eukprot:TRINITY_DN2626_c0_g1_i27.p1 TRINITY_DN2626_c0_g1~~TRINITY_DN2626_c0_g1_i27.p1  ORF type:complete len:121 (+),score=13.33 TRINITY_DN2626_c0_g1_i27:477-839(+)
MSSSSSGSCPAPLIHGDCTSNADCTGSSFCQFAPGTCSGVGNCTAIPSYCPDATVPVCGCDGFAYQTSCNAFLRSVSVASINSCFIPARVSSFRPGFIMRELYSDGFSLANFFSTITSVD